MARELPQQSERDRAAAELMARMRTQVDQDARARRVVETMLEVLEMSPSDQAMLRRVIREVLGEGRAT